MGGEVSCAMAIEQGIQGSLYLQGSIPWNDLDEDSIQLWSDDSGCTEMRVQVG